MGNTEETRGSAAFLLLHLRMSLAWHKGEVMRVCFLSRGRGA